MSRCRRARHSRAAGDGGSDNCGEQPAPEPTGEPRGTNFHLDTDRALARGWPARARDNIAAIRLSKELEVSGRVRDRGRAGACCCALPASALPTWRRTASAAPAKRRFAPAGRRPARRSKPPSRRKNTPPFNAPLRIATSRRRRSSAASGAPPNGSALPAGGCWNPAWAPACSSRCCPPRCATPASSPASNTIRSPPASPGWCIRRPGCGARTSPAAHYPAALTLP